MSVHEYLREDGTGSFKAFRVPDLSMARPAAPIELLIVLESPHTDEVAAQIPLAGKAGIDALRFVSTKASPRSLGRYVHTRHRHGDSRIALVNVSEVPLQAGAIDSTSRPLTRGDWVHLEKVRTRTASRVDGILDSESRATSEVILDGLAARISTQRILPKTTVALAGKFAQRFWRSLDVSTSVALLEVPHPSYDQWNRPSNERHPGLLELRRLFTLHSA